MLASVLTVLWLAAGETEVSLPESALNEATPNALLGQVLRYVGLDETAVGQAVSGQIIQASGRERYDHELSTGFAFIIKNGSLDPAAAALTFPDLEADPTVTSYRAFTRPFSLADFSTLAFSGAQASNEAKRYTEVTPGDTLNLSAAEMASFRSLSAEAPATRDAVEQQIRTVLYTRLQAYVQHGLVAIAPYHRGAEQRRPGVDLQKMLASASGLLAGLDPSIQRTLGSYPTVHAPNMVEGFAWVVHQLGERPTFTLRHRMVFPQEQGGLVMVDREIYASQGHNSTQIVGRVFKMGDDSLVLSRALVSTDQVTGFGSEIKRSVGRRMMAQQMMGTIRKVREQQRLTARR